MEETTENAQKQKPKICKLAIASPLVFFSSYWLGVVLMSQRYISLLPGLGYVIFLVSPFAGLILGIIAIRKINKSRGALKGYILSMIGLVFTASMLAQMLVAFLVCPPNQNREKAVKIVCKHRLAELGKALQAYSKQNDKYPAKDKWCDLLIEQGYGHTRDPLCYVCPGVSINADRGICHYAINPNCDPNSPGDIVLLFETKGGWNQYGGPEIMTVENHAGKGCNILFNNGDVNFVEIKQLSKLKWGNKPK